MDHDPDFQATAASLARVGGFDPLEHQRVVVNPFLAAAAAVSGLWAFIAMIRSGQIGIAWIGGVLLVFILPRLVHFHCLDCGRTGRYLRRRDHLCPSLINRGHRDAMGLASTSWLPSARAQLTFWLYVLGSVAVLLAVRALTG